MRDVCEFAALTMAQYFKSQISNYKMTRDFSELKNIKSRLEVRPMHDKMSIFRRKHIGIMLRNFTTMKELIALQDKDMAMGLGLGEYISGRQAYLC